MITPEEARNTMMKIESNDAYYGELQEELKLMATYIAQQEKKDKLLGLYRECNKEGVFWLEIQQRIAQLEKELEELK